MQKSTRRGRVIPLILAGLTVAAVGALGVSRLSAAPTVGKPAPAFTAQTVDGKKVTLAAYKGKSGVLLNFYSNT